jgi:DNA-binding MarR family transcriptional regulator
MLVSRALSEVGMMRPAEDEVLLALARRVVAISTGAADQLGGVSVVQLRGLTVLRERGTANLGRLADEMGVALSTASRLVDRLVRAGLVHRRPSPRTRREIELEVSPQGLATLDRYDDLRLAGLHAALAQVGDRAEVLAALDEFAGASRHGRLATEAAVL